MSSGGYLTKLYGGPGLLCAEWGKIHDLDPMWPQDSILELKNVGPRTSRHGNHVKHCHSLMMVVQLWVHTAGGELTFS